MITEASSGEFPGAHRKWLRKKGLNTREDRGVYAASGRNPIELLASNTLPGSAALSVTRASDLHRQAVAALVH